MEPPGVFGPLVVDVCPQLRARLLVDLRRQCRVDKLRRWRVAFGFRVVRVAPGPKPAASASSPAAPSSGAPPGAYRGPAG